MSYVFITCSVCSILWRCRCASQKERERWSHGYGHMGSPCAAAWGLVTHNNPLCVSLVCVTYLYAVCLTGRSVKGLLHLKWTTFCSSWWWRRLALETVLPNSIEKLWSFLRQRNCSCKTLSLKLQVLFHRWLKPVNIVLSPSVPLPQEGKEHDVPKQMTSSRARLQAQSHAAAQCGEQAPPRITSKLSSTLTQRLHQGYFCLELQSTDV